MKDDDFDMDEAFEIMSSNSFEDDNDSDFRNYGDDVSSYQGTSRGGYIPDESSLLDGGAEETERNFRIQRQRAEMLAQMQENHNKWLRENEQRERRCAKRAAKKRAEEELKATNPEAYKQLVEERRIKKEERVRKEKMKDSARSIERKMDDANSKTGKIFFSVCAVIVIAQGCIYDWGKGSSFLLMLCLVGIIYKIISKYILKKRAMEEAELYEENMVKPIPIFYKVHLHYI